MNYTTAVMLFNNDIRPIAVSYETDGKGNGVKPFTIFKTFDADIKAGDYVVVPTETRHGMTVCRVEGVDVEIDFDDKTPVNWIVGKISKEAYAQALDKETKLIEYMKKAENRKKREDIKKNVTEMLNDKGEMEKLALMDLSAATDAEVK